MTTEALCSAIEANFEQGWEQLQRHQWLEHDSSQDHAWEAQAGVTDWDFEGSSEVELLPLAEDQIRRGLSGLEDSLQCLLGHCFESSSLLDSSVPGSAEVTVLDFCAKTNAWQRKSA